MTEDEVLRLLDGDDHAVLQVCADWLEGNGQLTADRSPDTTWRVR